uniref:Uncharacterized protein n=1 Tax=Physcomitrium patens TaxID=3218 RepID=A0A2K1K6S8_PHYPA|nr:hypothetical protein PHYPA_011375 [Physcomitrium patens]
MNHTFNDYTDRGCSSTVHTHTSYISVLIYLQHHLLISLFYFAFPPSTMSFYQIVFIHSIISVSLHITICFHDQIENITRIIQT